MAAPKCVTLAEREGAALFNRHSAAFRYKNLQWGRRNGIGAVDDVSERIRRSRSIHSWEFI